MLVVHFKTYSWFGDILQTWQDPLRGGKDELFDYIVNYIHAGDVDALAKVAAAPPRKRLCPEPLLKLAGMVSPF